MSVVVLLVVLALTGAGLGTLSLRAHHRHQRVAEALQDDLLTQLPKIPGVRVLVSTAKHSVAGQEGGSSDCQATASVEVQTDLSPRELTDLLAHTTILGSAIKKRPGVLLVDNYSPLGSATLDWDC
jgi:hypothetical protein